MRRKKFFPGIIIAIVVMIIALILIDKFVIKKNAVKQTLVWTAPDTSSIPFTDEGNLIRYGRRLIVSTGAYFGPKGKISQSANGMNCENCHIAAGTRMFGNNFSLVAVTYPKFRARSNRYESIEWRVNECMERSMNGKDIDSSSKEMRAFVAYLKWVGKNASKENLPPGAGTEKLPFMNRAADTLNGKKIYVSKCMQCHGAKGQGVLNAATSLYIYPPLWGPHSYNIGAGLYRISSFAGYVKNNMPFGTTYSKPQLSNEEAWDVAAFVNSQPHPYKDLHGDYPKNISRPLDDPFGPYADTFSTTQHKYGPFIPIQQAHEKLNNKNF